MKKAFVICGMAILALGAGTVAADDGTKNDGGCAKGAAVQASADGGCAKGAATQAGKDGCCPATAAKAAYDETLKATGCEKTAKQAGQRAMAEAAYASSLAASHCADTAKKAAYEAVYADTKCTKTAGDAAQHAVAKAAYSETLAKTGCEKTAQQSYDKVMASAQPAVAAGDAHTS